MYESDATDDGLTNRVRACLQKLPETEREVLLLTAWEGLKPRRIAKVTGSTANLVRVRLHHARQRLAAELSPEEPASTDRDEPASKPLTNAPPMR